MMLSRTLKAFVALVVLSSAALLFSARPTDANSHLHPSLPNAEEAMARTHKFLEGQRSRRGRNLLQSSSSAAPYATNSAGLLIYTPVNSSALDPDDFSNFFYNSYSNNSVKGIALTPGNYQVNSIYNYTQNSWQMYMNCYGNFQRKSTFELNFEGTNLFLGSRDQGAFGWAGCYNVYFHGVNMTYAAGQVPFTQGTITNIGPTNWTIQIDSGYPGDLLLNGNGHLCSLYDSRGLLVQNGSEVYAGVFNANGNNSYTFQMGYTVPVAQVGMKLAIRGDTQATHVNYMNNCYNLKYQRIGIFQSNVFAVEDYNGGNNTYDHVYIIPDPKGVPGTTAAPLFSTNADGIHISLPAGGGPTITNCTIMNTGDDAIAVHGMYEMVAKVQTAAKPYPTVTVGFWSCADPSCLPINVNNTVLIYSPKLQNLGTAVVSSITATSNPGTINGTSPNAPAFNYDTANYFNLTFNKVSSTTLAAWNASAGPDGYITVPATCGNNTIVSGNTIGNNRARGIYTKSQNTVISNNRVVGSALVGIFLTPDTYFLEADYQHNLVVSGNYMNVTGAGIAMTALNATGQSGIYQDHMNASFTSNTIVGSFHPVVIGAATKVNFTGNNITDGACYPFFYNDQFYNQQTAGALTYTSYTTSSTFSKNTFYTTKAACLHYGNYSVPYQVGPGNTGTTFK